MPQKSQSSAVSINQVSKSYFTGELETPVLSDLNLDIPRGEFVVVLGVSGSGKTTLLNLIGALDAPTAGRIHVDGEEITGRNRWDLAEYRRRKMGFIFQFFNLLPTLTAGENVRAALDLLDLEPEKRRALSVESLKSVGLDEKFDNFPSQLSGGEQQRVAIARALSKSPFLVLADEPTGNLDAETGKKIVATMRKINRETGTTVIVGTHDEDIARAADNVLHIRDGRITL
jgi:putative ABC transport system ATP-binding protein